jgi:DNA-directed RNA polymerase specialized sigma24 family protein
MVGPPVDNHPMKVSNEETTLAQFEQTIVPHLNEAYNLAAGLTRSKNDAEDVVQ